MADQFYTPAEIAETCVSRISLFCEEHLPAKPVFVEPSAGTGVFLEMLENLGTAVGLDIAPRHPKVVRQDFLSWQPDIPLGKRSTVVAGNPPFGKRGSMAAKFISKAAVCGETAAFILPMCFTKFQTQKHIPEDMSLHLSERLGRQDFLLPTGRTQSLNTVFQIWSRIEPAGADLRKIEPESKTHPDFSVRQYNNTRQALRVFAEPFDFAVPCQGWQDYTRREAMSEACEKNKQWMLFKASDEETEARLRGMDFSALADETGTAVPGFRINDVVERYTKIAAA